MKNSNEVRTENAPIKSTVLERIYDCTDYMKYDLLDGNREVSESHVKDLAKSFEMYGSACARLIVVATKSLSPDGRIRKFLIDGQHSRIALNRLNLSVDVLVVSLSDDTRYNLINYMAMLNNTNKAWSPEGYIKAYAKLDIYEYKVLLAQRKETGLTPSDLLRIYLGRTPDNDYKKGNITFVDEANSERLLDATMKIKPYIPNKAFTRRSFYALCENTCNYEKFANAIITHYKVLRKANRKFSENEIDFKYELEYIYKEYKIAK